MGPQLELHTWQRETALQALMSVTIPTPRGSQNSLCMCVCVFIFNREPTRMYELRLVVSPGSLLEKKFVLPFFFSFILSHKTLTF